MDSGSNEQPRPQAFEHHEAVTISPQSQTPVYWQHRRYESYASVGNQKPPPITLEDNTEDDFDTNSPFWAKQVLIEDHVVVTGTLPRVGDYTVWNCRITTLDVSASPHEKMKTSFLFLP